MLPCDAGQTIKQTVLVCQPILFNIIFISTTYSASCNVFSTIEFESTIRSNLKNSKVYTYPETKFPCLCHTLCGNFMPMEPEARAGVTTFSTSSLWDTHNFQQLMADATKIQRLGTKAPDGRGKTRHGSLAAPTPLGFDRISSEVSGVRNHL